MGHFLLLDPGNPKLFVPPTPAAAKVTFSLYPAQRARARFLRATLEWALRLNVLRRYWPQGAPPEIDWGQVHWKQTAKRAGLNQVPAEGGVLAGNPYAEGRRYLYVAFDDCAQPTYVAKIGIDTTARRKVRAETDFLLQHGCADRGIPLPLGTLEDNETSGLILPYISGSTPRLPGSASMIHAVLAKLVRRAESIELGDIRAWQQITDISVRQSVSSRRVNPAIMHGDFAPWNILIDGNGLPHLVDWERGEPVGVPGWDWFHYVVQVECLVKRSRPHKVWQRLQETMADPAFQSYAEKTGIRGIESTILRGYCYHALELLKENRGGEDKERTERVLRSLIETGEKREKRFHHGEEGEEGEEKIFYHGEEGEEGEEVFTTEKKEKGKMGV